MFRVLTMLLACTAVLAGCQPAPPTAADGTLVRVYRINAREANKIPFRLLDNVNELRAAAGAGAVQLNPQLNAAAATHSADMARQNRPWHFGSDGSSPLDRARRAGFQGQFRGELISETFETELETLSAWMNDPNTRQVILDRGATALGFAWHQESGGKIWWTLVMGGPGAPTVVQPNVRAEQGT